MPRYYQIDKSVLPVIACRGRVLFPGQIDHIELESQADEESLSYALKNNKKFVLVSYKDPGQDPVGPDDYENFGTLVNVRQHFRLPGSSSKLMLEGEKRVRINSYVRQDPYLEAEVQIYNYIAENVEMTEGLKQIMGLAARTAVEYLKESGQIPEIFLYPLLDEQEPEILSNTLSGYLELRFEEAQSILEELDFFERFSKIQLALGLLSSLARLNKEISDKAQERMQQSQKDYVIREQINILKSELTDADSDTDSLLDRYEEEFDNLDLSDEAREAVEKELERLSYISPMSPEINVSRSYLDTIADLPWGIKTEDNQDLEKSRAILDRDHYSLKDVKERILEFLAVRRLREDAKGSILCFVGPPGVGKTSIAKSIAAAMNRNFVSMRLGGMTDESEIRGHRRTYVGSMPGRIIYHMTKAKSMNPVFLMDEIDKMGNDFRGDPASALLEVLDPAQNFEFQDRFLEIPFDLSSVMFLTTANSLDSIPAPLLDRLEIIRIPGYTEKEKIIIAKKFLLPKAKKESGLKSNQLYLGSGVLEQVIRSYTRESGVRELERQIQKLCRKAAIHIVSGGKRLSVTKNNLTKLLGAEKYLDDPLQEEIRPGLVNGLAWTQTGGELLKVEANLMTGRGDIIVTGSIGAVMQESARLSLSFVRANAKRYGIDPAFHNYYDIHIHMPEGAVAKDGPSAGVSMLTALVSCLTKRPVASKVAMTGEITLTGRVLAVGGVREKILAARRYGIDRVYLPKENMRDLEEVDKESLEGMDFIPVSHVDEIISSVLLDPVEPKEAIVFKAPIRQTKLGFGIETSKEMGPVAKEGDNENY